jgi:diketogulonate reductase-like aldo/keto reductase
MNRRVRHLGLSNVNAGQLESMLKLVVAGNLRLTPSIVQNRCYAKTGWDVEVRRLCTAHNITYRL